MGNLKGARISLFITLLSACLVTVLMQEATYTAPPFNLSRQKRVSDQRLAEIETLLNLKNVMGKLTTIPVGFGVVDPAKVGRRRRSSTNNRFQTLQRIMRMIANNPEMFVDEEKVPPLPLMFEESREYNGDDYQFI
ncbi:uncharacterized protein LOC128884880 [Hylaeus volcanicus]|uniref:uncharacterized protein LOC128884880 n=1 Tax=Hylaeus volcanicus TaxID=313075 RepID=UPI0023B81F9C|nr:uncharacterized protein LOC128884880 [Hylaeus volcanicus]